jgi:UDP-glucuronate decarboxylase
MKYFLPKRDLAQIRALLGRRARRFEGATILITGAGGFLGRYFFEFFSMMNELSFKRPCRLILMDNMITAGDGYFAGEDLRRVHFIRHDVTRPCRLEEPVRYIIHAAGIASPQYYRKYPLQTVEVATVGTRNMLELARDKGVDGMLYFSSSEIYGDPDPLHVPIRESYRGNVSCTGPRACYDESKRLGETLCTIYHGEFGVKTRTVRPFNVYGPGMKQNDYRVLPQIASRILRSEPMQVYGTGEQTRTFTYVTDAVNGFLRALLDGHPGEAYNIGNPRPEVSMLELLRIVGRLMGRPVPFDCVEHPDTYPADEPRRRCPDVSKAAMDFGFRPAVDLRAGLKRYFAWALKHYKAGTA